MCGELLKLYLHPKMQNKVPCICSINNTIHRPEEALDIQSEVIFVNGTVHLLQERNFGTPIILPSPATPPSSLTATHEAIFPLT